jgi:16S rRNA (adenine1518-N6/adenine1519-N6)-dimethyltransferase
MRARKSLGQNYLRLIAAEVQVGSDKILEIGCGTGNLTRMILQDFRGILQGVEVDPRAQVYLDEIAGNHSNFTYTILDALQVCYMDYPDYSVVGNLPYNIGSKILLDCIQCGIKRMVFLLQKEVVARISAATGAADYGSLSVLAQAYYNVRPRWVVGPSCFTPNPKIYSQVVVLERKPASVDFAILSAILRSAFRCRRKVIRQTLLADYPQLTCFNPALRPQEIEVQEYVDAIALLYPLRHH